MKKADLKTGMLVQSRYGDWSMVDLSNIYFEDYIWGLQKNIRDSLTYYNDDLTNKYGDSLDIVKVAKCNRLDDLFQAIRDNKNIEKINSFKILWQRESPEETQLKEVIDNLKSQLRDAEDKLAKIGRGN